MEVAGPEGLHNPEALQILLPAIERQAAMLIADMTEQYAQTLEPQEEQDPLVAIRQQELQLKAADMERKSQEFEVKKNLNFFLDGGQKLDENIVLIIVAPAVLLMEMD